MPATPRLLVVSNRLPVTAQIEEGRVRLAQASGGLATGLQSWRRDSDAVWIGWPGDVTHFTPEQRADLDAQLEAANVVPVVLSHDEISRYYEGFSNRVLWPLFHYLVDRVPVHATGWGAYRRVNERFARAAADTWRPGDVIWVHDYQLMLVPALLRELLPRARIGFFLHIPFPASEVFRVLPWRREILHGLLGADLVGFHTYAYQRHFTASLVHVDGIEADIDEIRVGARRVRVGSFPMSVDAETFDALARDPDVMAETAAIRDGAGGRRILLGIDRLDYTKGIPRRLLAIERVLTREPDLRDTVRYVQVAVPSRDRVEAYQAFRRQVEEAVGRVNGACATLRSMPVHYMYRSVSRTELAALYCAADVMLVTPLRDGMNLVAKEFVASRADGDGVLVLSEFAGAAAELADAIVVNPYDVDATAAAIRQALAMGEFERRVRMRNMRRRVSEYTVNHWASTFLDRLLESDGRTSIVPVTLEDGALARAVAGLREAPDLRILLDYDGTLVPIAPLPELAVPDAGLLSLLRMLAARPRTRLHLVSGRTREFIDQWFGDLPAALWAEHGVWHRPALDAPWESAVRLPVEALDRVEPILKQFTAATPGSMIEYKSASVAWHYRGAHPEFGQRQAHELRMLLGDALSNQPLEVLEGKKVIEVRLRGISKALVGRRALVDQPDGAAVLAAGDDQTDEELFAALPPSCVTIAVGATSTRARYAVAEPSDIRDILKALLA